MLPLPPADRHRAGGLGGAGELGAGGRVLRANDVGRTESPPPYSKSPIS